MIMTTSLDYFFVVHEEGTFIGKEQLDEVNL